MTITRRGFLKLGSATAMALLAVPSLMTSPAAVAETGKSVVLTAYGPFGGRTINSSERVGQLVSEQLNAAGYNVTFVNIPTEWDTYKSNLRNAVDAYHPDAIISLGEVGQVSAPTVETVAYNAGYGTDGKQVWFSGQLSPQGPTKRLVPEVNIQASDAVKRAGYNLIVSKDAGRYLCNAALYENLAFLDAGLVQYAGFVHVPARVDGDNGSSEDASTVTEFIKQLLQ